MPLENGDGESIDESEDELKMTQHIDLSSIVPIGTTIDYQLGYLAAQRTARANAYLSVRMVRNVAIMRLREVSSSVQLNAVQYLKGFLNGYQDEVNGLAHPLPSTDVPYSVNEFYFE